VRVAGVDGGQHQLFVVVRGQIEAHVGVVGERDERHLEAVRRLLGADRQRLDDLADQLHDPLKVLAGNAAGRVDREHDVHWGGIFARYTRAYINTTIKTTSVCDGDARSVGGGRGWLAGDTDGLAGEQPARSRR